MAHITDGGPAFAQSVARTDDGGATCSYDFVDGAGMSLRDYFAAKAMAALIAKGPYQSWSRENPTELAEGNMVVRNISESAYDHADAMLRARASLSPYNRDTARACRGAQSPAERQADHLKEFGK